MAKPFMPYQYGRETSKARPIDTMSILLESFDIAV